MELTQEILNQCFSYAAVLRMLEIPQSGRAQEKLKKEIKEKGFNIDHFTGQGWNKNNFDYSRFQKGKAIKAANARSAIAALRGYCCEQCGISEWQGAVIPLEVHHIDGDNLNNEIENLMLLCPNCHSITKNWRGRNIQREEKKVSDQEMIEAIKTTPNIRQALLKVGLAPKGGNYKRVYELKAKYNI